jgi:hypothetical protein
VGDRTVDPQSRICAITPARQPAGNRKQGVSAGLAVLARLYDPGTLLRRLRAHVRQADVDAIRFGIDGQVGLSQLREKDASYLRALLREACRRGSSGIT